MTLFYRFTSALLILALSFTQIIPNAFAQSISPLNLPVPGTMVTMSEAFVPVLLKGMTLNPKDPFHFDFIVDSGNTQFAGEDIKKESDRLVKYFMASMTVPKNDLWVNLSPYEKDRIIPDELGKTELGRDLLAQDYILKQLSSSLMYPDSELGAKFWEKVYSQAQEKYGVTDIPLNTFNKVWILPESASVYEHGNSVYITESHLKVMMDEDYKSAQGSVVSDQENQQLTTEHLPLTTAVMKEIILPAIEREVNTGKNFAPLRQIYHSLILAKWYKETVKQSILSQVYIDQNKVSGLEFNDASTKEKIYEQYMEAYKKGVYNFMKEEYDQLSQTVIPRQYFSGGFTDSAMLIKRTDAAAVGDGKDGKKFVVGVDVRAERNGNEASLSDWIPVAIGAGIGEKVDPAMLQEIISNHPVITIIGSALGFFTAYAIWSVYSPKWKVYLLKTKNPEVYQKFHDQAHERLKSEVPLGHSYNKESVINNFLPEAIILLATGKNFYVKHTPRVAHIETLTGVVPDDMRSAYPEDVEVVDSDESIEFITINKDSAQLSVNAELIEKRLSSKIPESNVMIETKEGFYEWISERPGESTRREFKMSRGPRYSIKDKVQELYPIALENILNGYDFQVIYTPEMGHRSEKRFEGGGGVSSDGTASGGGEEYVEWIVDQNEEVNVIRGEVLNSEQRKEFGLDPVLSDQAALAAPNDADVGGIDMNNIEMKKQGQGASIQFDPMDMDAIMKENIQGFVPVIINVTPVNSILPILGLEPRKDKEEYEVSQLN